MQLIVSLASRERKRSPDALAAEELNTGEDNMDVETDSELPRKP